MAANGKYKLSQENRMTRLETSLDEVKTNHLPHLEQAVRDLSAKLDSVAVGLSAKIDNVKVGMPPWMGVIFIVLGGLAVYTLTHK